MTPAQESTYKINYDILFQRAYQRTMYDKTLLLMEVLLLIKNNEIIDQTHLSRMKEDITDAIANMIGSEKFESKVIKLDQARLKLSNTKSFEDIMQLVAEILKITRS